MSKSFLKKGAILGNIFGPGIVAPLTVHFKRIARRTDLITERTGKAARVHMLRLHVDLEAVLPSGVVGAVRALEGPVYVQHLGADHFVHIVGTGVYERAR
jgi:hypothetical protein